MALSPWGAFALVCYVDGPLGSFLDQLRCSLSSALAAPAHITLLPPRPLPAAAETLSAIAVAILQGFEAFDVELGPVRLFPSNVLYLDVIQGHDSVRYMHQSLNTGPLAACEEFEFHPHVTLGGPFPSLEIDRAEAQAKAAWNRCDLARRFRVNQIVALWAGADSDTEAPWSSLFTFSLEQSKIIRHLPNVTTQTC